MLGRSEPPHSSAGLGKNKWKVPSPTVVLFHKSLGEVGEGQSFKKKGTEVAVSGKEQSHDTKRRSLIMRKDEP